MRVFSKNRIILLILLGLGTFFRFYNLEWDGIYSFHPDERSIAFAVEKIAFLEGKFNPHFFAYGSFPIYLIRLLADFLSVVSKKIDFNGIIFVGRVLSASAGVGILVLIYLLSRKLFSEKTALWATAFMTFAVLPIQLSHFATFEEILTFLCLLTIYWSWKMVHTPKPWVYLLGGVSLGLALATKISALPFAAALLAGYLLAPRKKWSYLFITGTAIVVTFIIFQPHAVLDPSAYWGRLQYEGNVIRQAGYVPYTTQYMNTPAYYYQLKELIRWSLGFPLGIISLLGLVFIFHQAYRHRQKRELFLLASTLPYLLINGYFPTKFLRYMMPVIPLLVMMGAHFLTDREIKIKLPAGRYIFTGLKWFTAIYTFIYALAFLNIYTRPHVWFTASDWVYQNIPRGSTLLTQHWEEGFPISTTYGNPSNYQIETTPYYDPDTPQKIWDLAEALSRGDYIIFPSKRLYGAILRAPERYPLTNNYFRLLFSENLGYSLVKTFTSYPGIGDWKIVDDEADESFSVYDHAKVVIFQKKEHLSPLQIYQRIILPPPEIKNISLSEIIVAQPESPPRINLLQKEDFLLRPDKTHFIDSIAPPIFWLLIIEFIGIIIYFSTSHLFPFLPDRGYFFSKTLGFLIAGYITWMMVSLHWLEYSSASASISLLIITILGGYFFRQNLPLIQEQIRSNRKLILTEEGIFLGSYIIFLIIRAYHPEIYWGEKPMDFSLLNAIHRSRFFPPYEPWFAGTSLNYYYFGTYLISFLSKLTHLPLYITFNLSWGLIPALVITTAFGIVYTLSRKISTGLIGAAMVGVIGNLEGIRQFFMGKSINFNYFWATSRILPDNAINEFPFWSFLFADLHAHVLAMPFTLLALAITINLLFSLQEKKIRVFHPQFWLIPGLVFGSIIPLNFWDFPPYILLLTVTLVVGIFISQKVHFSGSVKRKIISFLQKFLHKVILPLGLILIPSFIFYLPFYQHLRLSPLPRGWEKGSTAQSSHFLIVFGIFIFLIFSGLIVEEISPLIKGKKKRSRREGIVLLIVFLSGMGLMFKSYFHLKESLIAIFIWFLTLAGFNLRKKSPREIFPLVLVGVGLFIALACEFFYILDRMNTIFKFYLTTWFFLAISAAIFLSKPRTTALPRLETFVSNGAPSWLSVVRGKIKRVYFTIFYKIFLKLGRGFLYFLLAAGFFCSITDLYAIITTRRVPTERPTLNGINYLWYKDREEYAAIWWMNHNLSGNPIILEAQGESYQDYSRISMNTGLPTLLGWEYHLYQRGYSWKDIQERKQDVQLLYQSQDKDLVISLIMKYGINYIYLGRLESQEYPLAGREKFNQWTDIFSVAYWNPGVTIYRVGTTFENSEGEGIIK